MDDCRETNNSAPDNRTENEMEKNEGNRVEKRAMAAARNKGLGECANAFLHMFLTQGLNDAYPPTLKR